MKTTIEKRWWGKITTQRLKSNHGWIDQRKYYLFGRCGLCFLTQNNPVIISDNIEEMAIREIISEREA